MQDLHLTYRFSYALHPGLARAAGAPGELPLIVHDAHRAVRNAAAIAVALDVPGSADAPDGVFARDAEGAINLRYPRMPLATVREALTGLTAMLAFALDHEIDVLLCPAVWGAREIDPAWLP